MTDLWGTLTRTGTTGSVAFRRVHRTDIDDLWSALTDPERLARWFAPVELRGDGHYRIDFEPDDETQRSGGEILDCVPPRRLEVSWISPGEAAHSRVVVTLTEAADGTDLSLLHTGLPVGADVGYAAGWEVYLRQLEEWCAGHEPEDWWGRWTDLRDAYAATAPES